MTDLFAILLGGLLGLFSATAFGHYGWRLADRLPGEPFKPYCSYCMQPMPWLALIPIAGWALRYPWYKFPCPCEVKTGLWIQPAIEIGGLLLGLLSGALLGMSALMMVLAISLALLVAIALIDFAFTIIPDQLNLALGLLGLLWLLLGGGQLTIGLTISGVLLLLGLVLALGYSKLRKKEALGLGDVKFFAAAGLWLQPVTLPWFLIGAGVIGALFGLIWKLRGGGEQSPFAPALVFSFTACLIWQVIQMLD